MTAPAVLGRAPCPSPDGQRYLGLPGCLDHSVELDFHLDRLTQLVGVTSRWRGVQVDIPHPRRRDIAVAVHLFVRRGGHRVMRQDSLGRSVTCRDGSAVEEQRVGGDADSVVVPVALLHRVAEVGMTVERAVVDCVPRLGPDGQCNVGAAGHRHRFVELHPDLDRFPEFVGVIPRSGRHQVDALHRRRRNQAAVHLPVVFGGYRRVRQVGVGGAVGALDGATGEGQRVGGDADAVVVAVPLLHGVVEEQAGRTSPSRSGGVPRLRADGQRQPGSAGCRDRSVEMDDQFDRLPAFVGVAPRRRGDPGDALYRRR